MQGRLASLRAGVDGLLQGQRHVPRREAALTRLECLGGADVLWLAQIPYLDVCLLTCPGAQQMSAAPSIHKSFNRSCIPQMHRAHAQRLRLHI